MWESYYDTTSEIDQTETELFNWEHQTSPDTAPHSRRPLSIGPAPAYKYPSSSPPSVFGDKRSSPYQSNKAEFEGQQEKASQTFQKQQHQHHVFSIEMNPAQPLYAAIPTAIPIETSTYHGPDHQPHFQAATHPEYHSHYVQHPVNEQHAAHGLSTSAPEAGEPWNMHHYHHHHHHQQQQSRAPNWAYPGMPGALGRPASSGDQAVMAQGVGLVRYTSEETVAELTKEEKRARRKEQNRLAQQDLRRRRMEHTANLETRVEELVRTLEKKDHEIRMLQDIVRQLQRGGKPVTGMPELTLNGSLHPPALKEEYGSGASGLASPIQPIQKLQPPLQITVGGDSLGLPARPIVKRNVSDDEARLRLDMDMQPPSYSPVSLTVPTTADATANPGTYVEHQAYPRQAIRSAPAGVVEFPSDVQQHPSHHPHPLTPQQHAGGFKMHADRRASIVGYTGFEPYPQGGKLGLNVSGTGSGLRPTSSQQSQQKQNYQPDQHVPGYAPMITGYPPQSGLDTPPNGGPGAQTQTQTQSQTRPDYDYSLFHTSTSGASRAHPPASQQPQQQQHVHRIKPELPPSACPSDISASSSVMPLGSDVDEVNVNANVNVNQAGYEPKLRADGFVYPVNQVFPSPIQPGR